jgi:hypothetical protein
MTSTKEETARGLRLGGLRLVRTHQEDGTLSPELLTNLGFARGRGRREVSGGALLLAGASVLLAANAAAMGIVSWHAQYAFVLAQKHQHAASALEALGLDAAAVIFSVLGIALARLGRRAAIERVLVVACAAGSCGMNLLGADLGSPRSVAVYVMPPVLFAAGSDRLIAVVRRAAMGRREDDASQRSAWRAGAVAALYLLRFALAPPSTLSGARRALLAATPLPGAPAAPLAIGGPGPEMPPADEDHQDDEPPRGPRPGTKTARFLDLVRERYGDLAAVDPEKVSRICSELAPQVELDTGSARREPRATTS